MFFVTLSDYDRAKSDVHQFEKSGGEDSGVKTTAGSIDQEMTNQVESE